LVGVSSTPKLATVDGEQTRARIRDLVHAGAASYQQIADQLGIRQQTVAQHITRMDDAVQVRGQIAANKTVRQLQAFGETKTVYAWSKDGRCAVSINTLTGRLHTGAWAIEAAISTPAVVGQGRRGVPLTEQQADELRAAAEKVANGPKVHRHTPPDAPEAVAIRERNALILAAIGRRTSLSEIARATGLSAMQVTTIRDRGNDLRG
jgi:DNA-binding Lrp family transcriptional regulator